MADAEYDPHFEFDAPRQFDFQTMQDEGNPEEWFGK
jgi:hypothetical protein